jgi:hypothetical protein
VDVILEDYADIGVTVAALETAAVLAKAGS